MLFFIIKNTKMQGLLMLKEIYKKKRSKGIFVRENLKISIVIKNVIWSENTLMHKAVHPSNYFFSNSFTYNQAEQIQKEVNLCPNFVRNNLTKHGRFHYQGRTTFYTPVLVPTSRHMTSMRRDDIT